MHDGLRMLNSERAHLYYTLQEVCNMFPIPQKIYLCSYLAGLRSLQSVSSLDYSFVDSLGLKGEFDHSVSSHIPTHQIHYWALEATGHPSTKSMNY